MVIIIIMILAGVVISKKIGGFCFSFLGGVFGFTLGIALVFLLGKGKPRTKPVLEKHYIISIERNKFLNGKFLLGCGIIKGTMYYFYYEGLNNKYVLRKIKTDDTVIVEGEEKPCLLKKFYPIQIGWWYIKDSETKYEIYVPNNTILRKFKL